MSYEIDIDDDVMSFLKKHAEPFEDTPNSVLRRLLLAQKAAGASVSSGRRSTSTPRTREQREKRSNRAPVGSLLPEERYEAPLLRTIANLGGRGTYREVLPLVEERLAPDLTDLDKQTLPSGGVRWHTRLQFVRLRLIERGLIRKDSPRGVWALTSEGLAQAESLAQAKNLGGGATQ